MRLHFQECPNLADSQVLTVTQGDDLVEGTDKFEGISEDFSLVEALASAGNDLGEEVEGVDVLEDVGLLVGDEHHVELIQWLVYESNIILFDGGVLGARVGSLGERCEEGFDTSALDVVEGPGQNSLAAPSADGRSEDNLRRNGQLFVALWIASSREGYHLEFNSWTGCWGSVGRGRVGVGVGVGRAVNYWQL